MLKEITETIQTTKKTIELVVKIAGAIVVIIVAARELSKLLGKDKKK